MSIKEQKLIDENHWVHNYSKRKGSARFSCHNSGAGLRISVIPDFCPMCGDEL